MARKSGMTPRSLALPPGQVVSLTGPGISGGNRIYKEDDICFGHLKAYGFLCFFISFNTQVEALDVKFERSG